MGREMLMAVFGAVVVGSVGGGLAAWLSPSGSPAARSPAPPGSASRAGQPAHPAHPVAPPPDPHALLARQMRAVLTRFAEWSRGHAGAPCPDAGALGMIVLDPWGHAIELTCTDQPAGQSAGAISAGPEGIAGSADDVASWTLGREVTDLVRGARWTSPPAAVATPPATKPQTAKRSKRRASLHAPRPSALPIDAGADDIPDRR